MSKDPIRAIEQRWADYLQLNHESQFYQACTRLGEIANCLRFARLAPGLASKWRDTLAAVSLSPDMIQCIRNDADRDIKRLNQIIGIGSRFIYEEAMLLISLRVELEVVLAYLAERDVSPLPNLNTLDTELRAAMHSPENVAEYLSAQATARRNWGIPLRSEWLGTD